MPKKTISLPFCALCSVVLFILLILARCHGTRPAAEETAAAEKAVPVLMYHHLLKQAENTRYRGNDIVTYVEDFEAQLAWLHKTAFSPSPRPSSTPISMRTAPFPPNRFFSPSTTDTSAILSMPTRF